MLPTNGRTQMNAIILTATCSELDERRVNVCVTDFDAFFHASGDNDIAVSWYDEETQSDHQNIVQKSSLSKITLADYAFSDLRREIPMDAIEHLEDRRWEWPDSYMGTDWSDYYFIVGRSRDSDALEESNFECAMKSLRAVRDQWAKENPEAADAWEEAHPNDDMICDPRASHWAVGWVEELLVHVDAPDCVLTEAGEIICSLADYPVLDESDYSERECEAAQETWENMDLRERIRAIQSYGDEERFIAARHDDLSRVCNYADPSGSLYDYLRSPLMGEQKMFIAKNKRGYTKDGEQWAHGYFLILMTPWQPLRDPVTNEYVPLVRASVDRVRGLVRYVKMHQLGHFMMARTTIKGHKISLSGTYGSDGLLCDVPPPVWEMGTPIPPELYQAWATGGGHNSAGSEAEAMHRWGLSLYNGASKK